MTAEQALQIVGQAAALAPLPKAQHMQIERAIIELAKLIENQEKVGTTDEH